MKVWDILNDKPEFVMEEPAKIGLIQVKHNISISQPYSSLSHHSKYVFQQPEVPFYIIIVK